MLLLRKLLLFIGSVWPMLYIFTGDAGHKNLEAMKAGMFLRKVKSRLWKRQRHYKLQEDCKTIAYKSSWAINSYSTCKRLRSIIMLYYIGCYVLFNCTNFNCIIKLHTSLEKQNLKQLLQTKKNRFFLPCLILQHICVLYCFQSPSVM